MPVVNFEPPYDPFEDLTWSSATLSGAVYSATIVYDDDPESWVECGTCQGSTETEDHVTGELYPCQTCDGTGTVPGPPLAVFEHTSPAESWRDGERVTLYPRPPEPNDAAERAARWYTQRDFRVRWTPAGIFTVEAAS